MLLNCIIRFYNICGDSASVLFYEDFYDVLRDFHVIDFGIFNKKSLLSNVYYAITDVCRHLNCATNTRYLYITHFHTDHMSLIPALCSLYRRGGPRYYNYFNALIVPWPPYPQILRETIAMKLLVNQFFGIIIKYRRRDILGELEKVIRGKVYFVKRGEKIPLYSNDYEVRVVWPPEEIELNKNQIERLENAYTQFKKILGQLMEIASEIEEIRRQEIIGEIRYMIQNPTVILDYLSTREFEEMFSPTPAFISLTELVTPDVKDLYTKFFDVSMRIKDILNATSLAIKFIIKSNKSKLFPGNKVTIATFLSDLENDVLDILYEIVSEEIEWGINPFKTITLKAPHHGTSWGKYLRELIKHAFLVHIPWCPRKLRLGKINHRIIFTCEKYGTLINIPYYERLRPYTEISISV